MFAFQDQNTMSQDNILNLLNKSQLPIIDESQLFTNPPKLDQYNSTDFKWVHDIQINTTYLEELATEFESIDVNQVKNKQEILLKIIELIDLTTLSGDDTKEIVEKLTQKAIQPLSEKLKEKIDKENVHTAAVCVYPARVKDVIDTLNKENARDNVKVASVAGMHIFYIEGVSIKKRAVELKVTHFIPNFSSICKNHCVVVCTQDN